MADYLYNRVPKTPANFDRVVELAHKAARAIEYWEDLKKANTLNRSSDEYKHAATAVKQWRSCKADCERVIRSYQMELF